MNEVTDFLASEQTMALIRAAVYVITGIIIGKLLSTLTRRLLGQRLESPQLKLAGRIVFWLILSLFIASALRELGFKLTALLGAAGILSVALGFASQTSASNFISGLFLMAEKPFVAGDLIKVGETTGEVLAVDLLSVKIRTFDNRYVRIPNETLLKAQTTTLTKFPIRRIDLKIGVAYKEDIKKVYDVLLEVADHNPLCLEEPKPLFIFEGFGDSSQDLQFSVWTRRSNFLELKNSIQMEIKRAFDRERIEIPFPHRSIYTGSVTEPFPVRIVDDADAAP
jgi:small-conductance mechanosensitive channel